MGEIVLESDEFPDLLPMLHRTPGMHVSNIIAAIMKYDNSSKPERMMFELGNSFENMIKHRWRMDQPGRFQVPVEVERNGVYAHPDLFDYHEWVNHEMKVTWRSVNHVIESEFWAYWCCDTEWSYYWRLENVISVSSFCSRCPLLTSRC